MDLRESECKVWVWLGQL